MNSGGSAESMEGGLEESSGENESCFRLNGLACESARCVFSSS